MHKKLGCFLIILLALSAFSLKKTIRTEKFDYDFSVIDQKITSWIDDKYYDGASLMVVKDNQLIYEKYFGNYTKEDIVYVASAGKWIAAAVIAAVVDEGKLSWDDKASKYIPYMEDIKRDATLRQLLSHTAGYPDYQPEGKHRDDYQTLEEAVANIIYLPADTLPGTKFRYGGLSMQVAGYMAERATGKNWETLFREKIAQPLQMKSTHFTPVSKEGGFSPMLGGGLRTSIEDYMNFLNMIFNDGVFNGERVLSESAICEMQADQIGDAVYKKPEYVENARQNLHHGIYGLGEWREEIDKAGNATLISSPGWAGAYPWIDKKNNVYGFFLTKVNVSKANSDGFSSFYSSPVLAYLVRDIIKKAKYSKELKSGKNKIDEYTELYYEEMGKGTPVIFIHGHSLDHTMWDTQFFELAKKHRVVRYDLGGYGQSSMPDESRQFLHADDLAKLMDNLGIKKAHLVGLSLGGFVATDMLALYPEKLESVVLTSGNIFPVKGPSEPMSEPEKQKRYEEIKALKKKGINNMKREWFSGLMRSGGSQKETMRQPLWKMIAEWNVWQPLHLEPRLVLGLDVKDKLKQSPPMIPVLILEGISPTNNYNEHPEILDYLPQGKIQFIEDVGHMMNMEQPETFNRVIMNFIETNKK